MEYLLLKRHNGFFILNKKNVQGKHMQSLYDILDAEDLYRVFEMLTDAFINDHATIVSGNVIFARLEKGIATLELAPSIFGNDVEPFQTDEKQFKYMIREFNRLMEKKVPAIMITRDDEGTIAIYEPTVA